MTQHQSRILEWLKELKEGKRCLPHDSYDASCCEGDNSKLRQELIKKLEWILNG